MITSTDKLLIEKLKAFFDPKNYGVKISSKDDIESVMKGGE